MFKPFSSSPHKQWTPTSATDSSSADVAAITSLYSQVENGFVEFVRSTATIYTSVDSHDVYSNTAATHSVQSCDSSVSQRSTLEMSTGSFIAAARYGSATLVPPSVIGCGVGWLGIGTFLNVLFGSVTGSTALVENAGLLALTKSGSRRVVQISAVFMILFSVLGKVGAIFASIPSPIMAAAYCIFFGYVSFAGLAYLQFCNLNSFKPSLC